MVRFAPVRFVLVKSVPASVALTQCVSDRFARVRFASTRVALFRSVHHKMSDPVVDTDVEAFPGHYPVRADRESW